MSDLNTATITYRSEDGHRAVAALDTIEEMLALLSDSGEDTLDAYELTGALRLALASGAGAFEPEEDEA